MAMLNYWEFEGTLIKVYDNEDNKFINLEGTTDKGYPVELNCLVDNKVISEFGDIPKYSKLTLCGHFETFLKMPDSGYMKRKLVRICDHIIDIQKAKPKREN